MGTAIKTATSAFNATGTTVGSIAAGDVVEFTHSESTVRTPTVIEVRRRATGAIPIQLSNGLAATPTDPAVSTSEYNWEIVETDGTSKLYFWSSDGDSVEVKMWVF